MQVDRIAEQVVSNHQTENRPNEVQQQKDEIKKVVENQQRVIEEKTKGNVIDIMR